MRTETVIGVVGPRDMVERIMLLDASSTEWQLIGAPHAEESETFERLNRIRDSIDVVLFTGVLQYDLARRAGEIPVPASYLPLTASLLSSALLRGVLAGNCDPSRVSIDSYNRQDVVETYEEFGMPANDVHVSEYEQPESVARFADFHIDLYRAGKTTAAVTTVSSVARRLQRAGVPALRTIPSTSLLRSGLHAAAMLGAGSKLQDSQLATIVVEPVTAGRQVVSGPANYWQQELRLSLHRILLSSVRRMGATIRDLGHDGFIVHTTYGALAEVTHDYRVAPFLERIDEELGVAAAVGIGLGATARDAESHALSALERARHGGGPAACLIGMDGNVLTLPAHARRGMPTADTEDHADGKATLSLSRLVDRLDTPAEGPVVVDADQVAKAMQVSQRSARRNLQALVAQGLAWPMPPARPTSVGRPKQLYRLITEKLPEA